MPMPTLPSVPPPPKGTYLSEYKVYSLRSDEAINPTGTVVHRGTNSIFCQALTQTERFTIRSNKYVKSNVKHRNHLPELSEIIWLLFRGLCIMGYPSRLNQSTSLPHSQEGGRQHHASPHYRSWDGSSGVGQMCVTSLGYRRITRNYMGCYQKIENPTSVSLSYSNSSMLFRSCAN